MTPEQLFPLFAAYALCASSVIFLSLIGIAACLGLAAFDILDTGAYPKWSRILWAVIAIGLPEIGVISWAVYFGRARNLFLRLVCCLAIGPFALMQLGWLYDSSTDRTWNSGALNVVMLRILWVPGMLVGAAISYIVWRAMLMRQRGTSPAG